MKPTPVYLLDTNTFSYIADGRSAAARKTMEQVSANATIAISAITEGEVLYGLARKPQAVRLRAAVESLLSAIIILPWDSTAASAYATLRVRISASGKTLTALDTLIAAHAIAEDATLITHDGAFSQIDALHPVVNWATDL